MKPLFSATKQFFKQIKSDIMLCALLFVPIMMGLLFRFGVPFLEVFLCDKLGKTAFLSPYYAIFDLLLSAMTVVMFSASGALVILDESDLGLNYIYMTSPVGKNGYLLSRIGIPSVIAIFYCIIITLIFKLSNLDLIHILLLSLSSGCLGVTVALMIPSLARNRMEGMAISKLAGLIMLGIPFALFLPKPFKYGALILPSFWMTEFVTKGNLIYVLPVALTSLFLSLIFIGKFKRRVL